MTTDFQHAIAVNQKLGFARILIATAQDIIGDSIPERHSINALLDGAVSQLHDALVYLLIEIADSQKTKLKINVDRLDLVLQKHQDQGIANDLTRELNILKSQSSWLTQLLECKSNPLLLPTLSEFDHNKAQSSKPSLLATDAPTPKGSLIIVREWLNNVQQLIDRQRSQATEE